jgi:pre-mRNA-splicing factor 38A
MLDPLYADYSKLKYRDVNEWKLIHVDEFIDDLLTKPICCGIAMPRLPVRETLQEAGYLEEGPRQTALHDDLIEAGGIKDYLKRKVDQEVRKRVGLPTDAANNLLDHAGNHSYTSAISLWERRYGKLRKDKKKDDSRDGGETSETTTHAVVSGGNRGGESNLKTSSALIDEPTHGIASEAEDRKRKRKIVSDDTSLTHKKKKKKKEKKSSKKYGTLFKPSATDRSNEKPTRSRSKDEQLSEGESKVDKSVDQNSEEYWNNLRSSLGMNPLKKN